MIYYQQLRDAQPQKLREAGKRWKGWSDEFEDNVGDFKMYLVRGLNVDGVWSGKAAEAARKRCHNMQVGMQDKSDEPADIGTALINAADEIETCQKRLEGIVDEINTKGGEWRIEVRNSGDGVVKGDGPAGKEKEIQEEVDKYQTEIDGLVKKADQTDADCERKIRKAIERISNLKNYTEEAEQTATKIQGYLKRGEELPPPLKEKLRKNADDEYFAAVYSNTLGADGVLKFPAMLGEIEGMSKEERRDLMSSFSELVGTATNGEGKDARPEIKDKLVNAAGSTETVGGDGLVEGFMNSEKDLTYRKFWAMQKILQYGQGHIEGHFLNRVAVEVYENRYDLPGGGENNAIDNYTLTKDEWGGVLGSTGYEDAPMSTVLKALGDAPEAGREFFGADPDGDGRLDRITTLVEEHYNVAGEGPALTEALRLASTEFPEVDPQRDTPAHREAGAIASTFLHSVAEEEHGFDNALVEEKRDIARTMGFYYEDLREGLLNPYEEFPVGAREGEIKNSPLSFQYGANISSADTKELLELVWEDQKSKQNIFGAAAMYAEADLRQELEDDPNQNPAKAAMKLYGRDVGMLIDAAYSGEIDAAEKEEAWKTAGKVLLMTGAAATAPLGTGAAAFAAGLSGLASEGISNLGPEEGSIRDQMTSETGNTYIAARVGIAEMLIQSGHWPAEDMPPENLFHDGHFDVQPDEREQLQDWLDEHATNNIVSAHDSFMAGIELGKAKVS